VCSSDLTDSLRIGTTFDKATGTFLLHVYGTDALPQTERFTTLVAFEDRLKELERKLREDHWTPSGASLLQAVREVES